LVDRPNVYIKIPATAEGVPAVAAALAEGVNVNVTLIFSLNRYAAVLEAFQDGIERATAAGRDPATIRSVASFFVSRLDTEVDRRLYAIGSAQARSLVGAAAIANARLAYKRWTETFSAARWRAHADAGARTQRLLWASSTVKDPRYPDLKYVEALMAPDTVVTMPEALIAMLAGSGITVEDRVSGALEHAQAVLVELAGLGIDYEAIVAALETEGVADFRASWVELLGKLSSSLGRSEG
jgi:transaldolase